MYYFLLTLLVLDALLLTVVVLLQSGKGGGLAAMGAAGEGSDTLFGAARPRRCDYGPPGGAVGSSALALLLSVVSTRTRTPESILRSGLPGAGGAGGISGAGSA